MKCLPVHRGRHRPVRSFPPHVIPCGSVVHFSTSTPEMCRQVSAYVPGEAVQQGHDLLPGQLEALRGAVLGEVLDLLLGEEDLQSRAEALSLGG